MRNDSQARPFAAGLTGGGWSCEGRLIRQVLQADHVNWRMMQRQRSRGYCEIEMVYLSEGKKEMEERPTKDETQYTRVRPGVALAISDAWQQGKIAAPRLAGLHVLRSAVAVCGLCYVIGSAEACFVL